MANFGIVSGRGRLAGPERTDTPNVWIQFIEQSITISASLERTLVKYSVRYVEVRESKREGREVEGGMVEKEG